MERHGDFGIAALTLVSLAKLAVCVTSSAAAQPLATLEYRVTGAGLTTRPTALAVPKGVAGSFIVEARGLGGGASVSLSGDGDASAPVSSSSAFVEGILRGPGLDSRRVVGVVNQPILLPPLNVVGSYSVDNLRVIDPATRAVIGEPAPSSIPVRVFDEVLVARVTSRPLSSAEIREKGIFIDESSFSALEFEVGFVVDGERIPVKFPVVKPSFAQRTEIIPQSEVEAALVEADLMNAKLAEAVELPPAIKAAELNLQFKTFNVESVLPGGEKDLELKIPPIAGLLVIPGDIGFLNQFFSVQVFVENVVPAGSGLTVTDVTAELVLPTGDDLVPGESHADPGDDPLRFARIGPNRIVQSLLPVRRPGPDGTPGTEDDIARLRSGEVGEAEFLVEGLREGLHVIDVRLAGTLEGLVAGAVEVEGRAAGSVLVRNPNFSLAFSHPRTIRAGEPYEASAIILNTSNTPANQVSVTLPATAVSGASLESAATVDLGDIAPGGTAVATFQLRAQRTGSITFSNLTSDDGLVGRFRLRMGVDERGVALSPDSIGYPDFVNELPADLFRAADRVMGQALGVATAGQLPGGITRVDRSTIQRRAIELAEAGQRLRYGDDLGRVALDLMLDFQGARTFDAGFDEIVRATDAGAEWRAAVMETIRANPVGPAPDSAPGRLFGSAADLAGRGDSWWIASSGSPGLAVSFTADGGRADAGGSDLEEAVAYAQADGAWVVVPPRVPPATGGDPLRFEWSAAGEDVAGAEVAVLRVDGGAGTATELRWAGLAIAAGGGARFDPFASPPVLALDADGDGAFEAMLEAETTAIDEVAPAVIGAVQDVALNVGRPPARCLAPDNPYENFATVVGLLFNKPMGAGAAAASFYQVDGYAAAGSVAIQPGGRVALLNLEAGVGPLVARDLVVDGAADPRGNRLPRTVAPIDTSTAFDDRSGVPEVRGFQVDGRVLRADGSIAAGIPVTLTYHEQVMTQLGDCIDVDLRPSQVLTDADGRFHFDLVLSGIPYSLSATDTRGLTPDAIDLILQGASDGRNLREKLLELIEDPEIARKLVEAFEALGGSGNVTPIEAVALAEGIDRAVLKDMVRIGSPVEGRRREVALRFRGRGIVTGTVVASDGVTPVANAAVNLFPDPESRELGRGIFTDQGGSFAFFGVPLGIFSVEVTAPDGTYRTVSDFIDVPGEVGEVRVVLTETPVPVGTLAGTLSESDGTTPHAGGRVLVGELTASKIENVVAMVDVDALGFWQADDIPAGVWDVVGISADGKRSAIRRQITVAESAVNRVNLSLQGMAIVRGRVEFANGTPAGGALVAGGTELVTADASGVFVIPDVPLGERVLSAGLERDPDRGIDFPRIGSARLEVVPGDNNFAVIRFEPRGSITGVVRDASGEPVPNVTVRIPVDATTFFWVDADANGRYLFEALPLGEYTLSAPGPAVNRSAEIIEDAQDVIGGARDGEQTSNEDLLGAITNAFAVFAGLTDPNLTGENENFNPISWGFAEVALRADGRTVPRDIVFLPEGTVSGTVLNGQGVPIGARVRLTGIGPDRVGDVSFIIRGERNSDPATGEFEFPGQALAGPWGLQAASPFFPVVIKEDGRTSRERPDATGIVLQFPPEDLTSGRLVGQVLLPDGAPAAGVKVRTGFGSQVVTADAEGRFDSQIDLPRGTYRVEAAEDFVPPNNDPNSSDLIAVGLRGETVVTVVPGVVNEATVRLLDRTASLVVHVRNGDGTAAAGAAITVRQGTFPFEQFDVVADADGLAPVAPLFEGWYSVLARGGGAVTLRGRATVSLLPAQSKEVTVTLQPSGTIRGIFVEEDGATPVPGANVIIGDGLAFAPTDDAGFFEVVGLPLGSHPIRSSDPVNGRVATGSAVLNFDGQVVDVLLVVRSLGRVTGFVINSTRSGTVPGATVRLTHGDGLQPPRSVTTGPDGGFEFPAVLDGRVFLNAFDPVARAVGNVAARLDPGSLSLRVDVPVEARGSIRVRVLEPDGVTPADDATVAFGRPGAEQTADTDAEGIVTFENLRLAGYPVNARSMTPGLERSGAAGTVTVSRPGPNGEVQLVLAGVGVIGGTVTAADGVTVVPGAQVDLVSVSPALGTERRSTTAGDDGSFSFAGVAVGDYTVTARSLSLAGSTRGTLGADGEIDTIRVALGPSGRVTGTLVREDGATPAGGASVTILFDAAGGVLGVFSDVVAPDGSFAFSGIPVGGFRIEALLPEVDGIFRAEDSLSSDGESLDLGLLVLDEANPVVVSVNPPDTAAGVPVDTDILVAFSEAIDPGSIDDGGIYLCLDGASVPAAVTLENDGEGVPRLVRLDPLQPLASEGMFEVVVLDGERLDPGSGAVIAGGPVDRVGRPLAVPFVSTFTTEDAAPPRLLSLTPPPGGEQVDPRTPVRLSFDEAVDPAGLTATVTGPAGTIPGRLDVGVNGQVVAFVPSVPWPVDATITASIDGIRDLAGNVSASQPFTTTFATLDTIGPEIAVLRIAGGASPEAGGTIGIEAVLDEPDPAARIRLTGDLTGGGTFTAVGESTVPGVLEVPLSLPDQGRIVLRANAIDRFGNVGPFAELAFDVVENAPPEIVVTKVSPDSEAVPTGGEYIFRVSATDATGVTELRAAMSDAAEDPLRTTAGQPISFAGTVSPEAGPDQSIVVTALAVDSSGESTGARTFSFPIADGTPPTVALTSPESGPVAVPGESFNVAFEGSDAFGIASVTVETLGAFAFSETLTVDPVVPGVLADSVSVAVPAETPPDGAPFTVRVTARDAAGLVATAERGFTVVDRTPPLLVSLDPPDGFDALATSPTIRATFSEPLDPGTVDAAAVRLERVSDGVAVELDLALEEGDAGIVVRTTAPLDGNTDYRLTLAGSLADPSGNELGSDVAAAYRTADFVVLDPPAGARLVEGQRVTLRAGSATGADLGIDRVRYAIGGSAAGESDTAAGGFPVGAVIPALDVVGAELEIRAEGFALIPDPGGGDPAESPRGVALRTVEVLDAEADTDGDGLLNGDEIALGTDFLVDDAGEDPDEDGLTHAQELAAGTKAFDPDTDDDGLDDGTEVALGTSPIDDDSDDDGILDGADPFPNEPNRAPVAGDDPGLLAESNEVRVIDVAAELLANDSDPDGDVVTLASFGDPDTGSLEDNGDGTLSLTFPADFTGPITFQYTARDPFGLEDSAAATVTVRDNVRPLAVGDPAGRGIGKSGIRWVETAPFENPAAAITVAMWARSDTPTWNANGSLLSKRNAFILYTDLGSKRLRFIVFRPDGTNVQAVFTPDIDLTAWHHYAGSYDGAMVRLFIDGEEVAATPMTGPVNLDPDPLFIGRDDGINSNAWFNGQLDEVVIWETARTEAQIREDRFTKLTGAEPGLFAHWNFDVAADPIADLGPNGITATRQSFPSFVSSPVPFHQSVRTDEDTPVLVDTIGGTDEDGDLLTGVVTRLPEFGTLFQTDDGVTPGSPVLFDSGRALRFDGVDDFATIPGGVLGGLEDVTVEFFYQPRQTGGTHTILYVQSGNNGFKLSVGGASANTFFFYGDQGGTDSFLTLNSLTTEIGRWYHFAVVRRLSEGLLEIYVDGVLRRTLSRSFAPVGNFPAMIGARGFAGTTTDFLNAGLDDLRIWNTALDEDTINARRSTTLTGAEPNLVAYYPFDSLDPTRLVDSGPGGLDGFLASGSPLPDPAEPRRIASTAPLGDVTGVLVGDAQRRLIYEPFADFSGIDAFRFRVNDGFVDSDNEAIGHVIVGPVNDAPTVADDTFFTLADTPLRTASVLANDFDTEAESFSVASFTQPANGSATDNGDGTFTYTPIPGFTGQDAFTYTATDGEDESLPATVTIEVDTFPVVRWAAAASGDWNDPANWDPARVPGPEDKALIDQPGGFTVTVPANIAGQVAALELRGAARLDLAVGFGTRLTVGRIGRLDEGTTLALRSFATLSTGTAGQIIVEGAAEWDGGKFAGTGIATLRGATTVDGGGTAESLTLRHEGTLDWVGGSLSFSNGTKVVNAAGADWNVPGDRSVFGSGSGNRFLNEGALRKTDGSASLALSFPGVFESTGVIDIASGKLGVSGPTISITGGTVSLPSGTALEIVGGAGHIVENTAFPDNVGRLSFRSDGNVLRIRDITAWGGPIDVGGGTIVFEEPMTFNGPVNVASFQSGIGLAEPSVFKAGGKFINLNSSKEIVFEGASEFAGVVRGNPSINRGTLTITSGQLGTGHLRNEAAVIQTGSLSRFNNEESDAVNAAGATWEVRGNPTTSLVGFVNAGTLRRTSGDGAFTVRSFTSTGDVEILTGSLVLTFGDSAIQSGSLTFADGTTLRFEGNGSHVIEEAVAMTTNPRLEVSGSTINPTTTVTIKNATEWSGPVSAQGGVLVFTQAVTFRGSVDDRSNFLSLQGGATFEASTTLRQAHSPADLIFEGDTRYDILRGEGTKINRGTMTTNGSLQNTLADGDLRNEGVFTQLHNMNAANGARLENAPGAIWDIAGDVGLNRSDSVEGTADFTNEGEVRKSAGAGEASFHPSFLKGTFLNAGGTVRSRSGTLRFQGPASQTSGTLVLEGGGFRSDQTFALEGGVLAGAGAWTGSLDNSGGIVRPGSPLGTLAFSGGYTQGAGGRLEIEIGGAPGSGNVDLVTVGGTANLGGTFGLAVVNGHVSPQDEAFDVVAFAGRLGDFASYEGLSPGNGVTYAAELVSGALRLTAGPEVAPLFAAEPDVLRFGSLRGASAEASGDPDGDGVPNLIEYALATDPLRPDAGRLDVSWERHPETGRPCIVLAFDRRASDDVRLALEASDDLATWRFLGGIDGQAEVVSEQPVEGRPGVVRTVVRCRDTEFFRPRWFRLRVGLREASP